MRTNYLIQTGVADSSNRKLLNIVFFLLTTNLLTVYIHSYIRYCFVFYFDDRFDFFILFYLYII